MVCLCAFFDRHCRSYLLPFCCSQWSNVSGRTMLLTFTRTTLRLWTRQLNAKNLKQKRFMFLGIQPRPDTGARFLPSHGKLKRLLHEQQKSVSMLYFAFIETYESKKQHRTCGHSQKDRIVSIVHHVLAQH